MSSGTDAVLASIDGALDDWRISGDAMRWNPALKDAREPPPLTPIPISGPAAASLMRGIQQCINAAGKIVLDAARTVQPFTQALARTAHRLDAAQHPGAHIRCRSCHPAANPQPLCVDGRAYHRRQVRRGH
jgi:hypothetical protein